MKGRTLLLLAALLFIQKATAGVSISAVKNSDFAELTCQEGKWSTEKSSEKPNVFEVSYYKDAAKKTTCENEKSESMDIVVRVRTCENCIEMNPMTLTAIAVSNILATIMIGVAVYCLSAQPKGRSFSGNKASDKVNLISNGDGDMYQSLNPGQKSEYQALGPRKK